MEMLEEVWVVVIGWDGREKLNETSVVLLSSCQINDSVGLFSFIDGERWAG
jgi:hypothetical protein